MTVSIANIRTVIALIVAFICISMDTHAWKEIVLLFLQLLLLLLLF